MRKNIICLSLIVSLAAVAGFINGCSDLYAVKAMREKQQQVRTSEITAKYSDESASSEEAVATYKQNYTSDGKYKDAFLYEKEAPIKPEKELPEEKTADGKTPEVKPEPVVAASGPNEIKRLRELRDADEKAAVAAGKPKPRKVERSDVGLTDPINVPKSQNQETIAPPAELLKPIVIDSTEKDEENGIVPSKPKVAKASGDKKVNDELKKLASKIENKPSPVLPREEPEATPAPATQPKAEPVVAAATPTKDAPVPAAGFDWNKLSATKKEETPAETTPVAKPETKPEPAPITAEPVKKAEEPKAEPVVAEKTPEPVKTEPTKAETPKEEKPATVTATPVAKPQPAPAAPVTEATPAKTPEPAAPTVAVKKTEKTDDNSWEMEFEEKPAAPTKAEQEKAVTKIAEKEAEENIDWGLPKKEAPKEPVVETKAAAPTVEPKKEEPATVEIKLANSTVPESTFVAPKKTQTKEAPIPATKVEIKPTTETPKETKPVQVAIAEPKPQIAPSTEPAKKPVEAAPAVEKTKPAAVVTTPAATKPVAAPVVKPAPKKPAVEPVVGTDKERVFKGWPGTNMILKSGMDRLLSWMPDNASQFSNLRLMFSSNGGKNWKTVASGMKPGRIAAWTVPVVTSDNCRLKIVGSDESGEDVTLAISDQFSVNTGVWETIDSAAVK